MRVLLTTDRAGATFVQYAGEEIDLPDREAMRLIRSGSAEPVERESASVAPRETMAHNRARPRRK